jgi:hypothetical protein
VSFRTVTIRSSLNVKQSCEGIMKKWGKSGEDLLAATRPNTLRCALVPRSINFLGNNSLACSTPNILKTLEKGY